MSYKHSPGMPPTACAAYQLRNGVWRLAELARVIETEHGACAVPVVELHAPSPDIRSVNVYAGRGRLIEWPKELRSLGRLDFVAL